MTEMTSTEFYDSVKMSRTGIHPTHWPDGVEILSLNGLNLLGIGQDGALYLDGKRLYTERRLAAQERVIAWLVAFFTAIAAIAAVWQAAKC